VTFARSAMQHRRQITGHQIDVYPPPPASSSDPCRFFGAQRIYVIKPHH